MPPTDIVGQDYSFGINEGYSGQIRVKSVSLQPQGHYPTTMTTSNSLDFIAAVGLAGTGKSTFVNYLATQTQWPTVYFGGQVLQEVRARGLEQTPDNERLVREDLRRIHGSAAMAKLALTDVDLDASRAWPLIIDGLYSDAELTFLRERLADRLLVVAIHASFETRARRLANRPSRPLTAVEIRQRDRAEVEHINKAPPIALADKHFVNDGDLTALQCFADEIVFAMSRN